MQLSLCERERNQLMLTLEDLQTQVRGAYAAPLSSFSRGDTRVRLTRIALAQILWTHSAKERDLTQDHRVWCGANLLLVVLAARVTLFFLGGERAGVGVSRASRTCLESTLS